MRSIIKIAIGTALGILLAGLIAGLVVFGLIGAAINDGSDDRKPTPPAAAVAGGHDTDGDGQPDTADPDPYSANSASYESAPEPTPKKKRSVARTTTPTFVACDPNISVKAATTTCPFAQNVFYGYWQASADDFSAYSAASKRSYDVSCSGATSIVCTAGDGAEVRFSARAVALYDQAQADAYAASHDLGPDANADGADDEEAYEEYDDYEDEAYDDYDAYGDEGYNDGDGSTEPGENIPNYDEGDGYRVQCEDGTYSQSGGIQGACSHHGGVR
jgi:hypothetical protein